MFTEEEQPIMPLQGVRPSVDDSLGSLQYQLENIDIIDDIIRILKNEKRFITDRGEYYWAREEGTACLLNERGVQNIRAILQAHLNKVIILSDFDKDIIKNIMNYIHEDLTDDFYYNWKSYDIKDGASAAMIVSIVTNTVYASFRKGFAGHYLQALRKMHSVSEVQQSGQIRMKNQDSTIDKVAGFLQRRK